MASDCTDTQTCQSEFFLLLIIATPLAWWLSQTQSLWRKPIGALITLPLVLPPTVLGFYMLALLGPQGWVGQVTQSLGIGVLSFSFTGLLIGSLVFRCPLPSNLFSMPSRQSESALWRLQQRFAQALSTLSFRLPCP